MKVDGKLITKALIEKYGDLYIAGKQMKCNQLALTEFIKNNGTTGMADVFPKVIENAGDMIRDYLVEWSKKNEQELRNIIKEKYGFYAKFCQHTKTNRMTLASFFKNQHSTILMLPVILRAINHKVASIPSVEEVKKAIIAKYGNLTKCSRQTGISYSFIYDETHGAYVNRNTDKHKELFKVLKLK